MGWFAVVVGSQVLVSTRMRFLSIQQMEQSKNNRSRWQLNGKDMEPPRPRLRMTMRKGLEHDEDFRRE